MDMRRLLLLAAAIVLVVLGVLQFTGASTSSSARRAIQTSRPARRRRPRRPTRLLCWPRTARPPARSPGKRTLRPCRCSTPSSASTWFGRRCSPPATLRRSRHGAPPVQRRQRLHFCRDRHHGPCGGGQGPKAVEQIDRNTAAYSPELGRYMDGQLVLQGAIAEVVAADTCADRKTASTSCGRASHRRSAALSRRCRFPVSTTRGGRPAWRR